jgi:hypothetical protein
MKSAFLFSVLAILTLPTLSHGQGRIQNVRSQPLASVSNPVRVEAELITHLPSDLPQRVSGFAFDGEKFWVMIYQGRGRYATLNPVSLIWQASAVESHSRAIREVAGAFQSPGGVCFGGGKLWIAGSYGESFGSINMQGWKIERLFKGKFRDDPASQSYSSMVHDGNHLWMVWHWMNYELPVSETQLLLKIEPDSGKVVGQYPLPGGTAPDMTHGLTWDGTKLWHMKDNKLSAIDPTTGTVTTQYILEHIKRPSGLAWYGEALWIIEFGGNVWRLRI